VSFVTGGDGLKSTFGSLYHIKHDTSYWYGDNSPSVEHAFIASIKTGLPLNAVMMSPTSISQTLGNLDIWFEPYRKYPVLSSYKPGKPLLLLQSRNGNTMFSFSC